MGITTQRESFYIKQNGYCTTASYTMEVHVIWGRREGGREGGRGLINKCV